MGIQFFKKNRIDLDLGSLVTISITDAVASDAGNGSVNYLRDRSNDTGWGTVASTDAANTQIDVDMGDLQVIDNLFFFGINWKAYTCKYYDTNTSTYIDFSTPISVSGNSAAEKNHVFNSVEIQKFRIIITGTMTVDDDKQAAQIIATEKIGEFTQVEPWFADFQLGKNKRSLKLISGKGRVIRNVGGVSGKIVRNNVTTDADLSLIETLHDYRDGFLVYPSGGTINQFRNSTPHPGWRLKDMYLMAVASELPAEFDQGRYKNGIHVEMSLIEVA
jgi:hypothetical protein